MILRRVTGRNAAEALSRVEREMGPGALIVETRHHGGKTTILASHPGRMRPARRHEPPEPFPGFQAFRPGFRTHAENMVRFGLSPGLIKLVYRALVGLDPHLLEGDSPSLPRVLAKVLAGLIPTDTREGLDRRITVLVGPTGVGKTTTLAKLVAEASLDRCLSCAVLTLDTFRIAAVDQLKAFAEMMDIPIRVPFSPGDLRKALAEFGDRDRIFIDTTGRSPRDRVSILAMSKYLRDLEAGIHLCLPAGGRRPDLELVLDSFGILRPSHVLLTKWDETFHPGEALSLAMERNLPLSWITDGQRVPEDLCPVEGMDLAQSILAQSMKEKN